ncbi:MAG TPA: hypothetical protein VGS11_01195 [Candidatus Bathyarchaeia archaeon]|nr:hypothetical protein [Candidatus Bathyarchaeia archaeon]
MKKSVPLRKNKRAINTILAALLMVVIVVVASVMVYAWSTGLLGSLLVKPTVGQEALNVNSSTFTSNTNVTLYVGDSGSISVTLQSYYVKDSMGNSYQLINWAGPTITPGGVSPANLAINSSCSGCQLTGNAFTFTNGYAYTIVLVSTRNNQFTFNLNR